MSIMNTTANVSTSDVASNDTAYVVTQYFPIARARVYDTAGWTFESQPSHDPNLGFLPILCIIILIVGCLLKAYKWSRDSSRRKARGDVEFGDEAEVNYGIITPGDKDFCPIDIRADGASVYDTVNSVRWLGNGYATQLSGTHPYYDTVTSYKSLLMQRPDGGQYDSVKSYKAFLQKVTQNKDLAVEVKLLENYPIRSKSAEHCVVLEEESSERSEDVASRMLGTLPLNKQLHEEGRFTQFDKKRPRTRRASGDVPTAMRKRSASNPTYRRVNCAAASLPSIRYPLSSDSDEDTPQTLRTDRKKLWAERRKISRSTSGNKIAKDPGIQSTPSKLASNGIQGIQKRRRHYSADSARRPRKAAVPQNKENIKCVKIEDLKPVSVNKPKGKSSTKTKKAARKPEDESSSENPNSSHSSCEMDVASDAIVSESDDETKQNTLLSIASDDRTMDNDVFFSLDSGAELASSSEILESSPKRPLSETKKMIARAKEQFFLKADKPSIPLELPTPHVSKPASSVSHVHNENSSLLPQTADTQTNIADKSSHDNHSTSAGDRTNASLQHASGTCLGSQADSVCASSKSSLSTDNLQPSDNSPAHTASQGEESQIASSPRKVQRFQVTFVNADISSLNSD